MKMADLNRSVRIRHFSRHGALIHLVFSVFGPISNQIGSSLLINNKSHGLSSFPQQTNGGQSESYPEGLVEGYLEKPRVRGK